MPKLLGEPFNDTGIWHLPLDKEDVTFQWCCDCGLRHTVVHRPVKVGKRRYLRLTWYRDDLATKLRKFYDRTKRRK